MIAARAANQGRLECDPVGLASLRSVGDLDWFSAVRAQLCLIASARSSKTNRPRNESRSDSETSRLALHATLVSACLFVLAWSGCGSGAVARGTVLHPASLALDAFPRMLVAGGHLDYELSILTGIVLRLQEMGIDAEHVELETLEPMRRAGRIPPGSAVLVARSSVDEETRPEWSTRPETVCGAFGCYTDHRTVVYDVPMTRARFELVLYEGPTARVLRRVTVQARDEGGDYDSMRLRVADELVERIGALLLPREETVEIKLLAVDLPENKEALRNAHEGRWTRARQILETAARSPAAQELSAEQRARLQYNLGQARRFDPVSLAHDPEHFADAARALRSALRLDRKGRYAKALRELNRHRVAHAAYEAQRLAAQSQRATPAVPDAPPTYRDQPAAP